MSTLTCPSCGTSMATSTSLEKAATERDERNRRALVELASVVARYRKHNDEVAARYLGISLSELAGRR